MEKKMNRREFVKASLATGGLVLAGDMVKGGISLAYGAGHRVDLIDFANHRHPALRRDAQEVFLDQAE